MTKNVCRNPFRIVIVALFAFAVLSPSSKCQGVILFLLSLVEPIGVERPLSRLVNSMVRVRSEIVPLRLQQICRQHFRTIRIVIR